MKGSIHTNCFSKNRTEYLYRDAQGNILAIYNRQRDSVWLNEWDIYGNKRVGVVDTNLFVGTLPYSCSCTPPANPIDSSTIGYLEGQKQYELTNHLGNVLVTVSDKKTGVDTTATPNVAQYYLPVIINAQDYYPFGMIQPGRQYAILGDSMYMYAFNGMMKDNDIYGQGNSYATEFREFDPRLGRWLTIDPLFKKFAGQSPYVAFDDNPINIADPNGAGDPDLGQKVANTALKTAATDTRTYPTSDEMVGKKDPITKKVTPAKVNTDPTLIDCSKFTQEVAKKNGYDIPRTADAQADYFKNNGEYSEVKNGDVKTVLNSAKVGDHIFFKVNKGVNHTGIISKIDDDGSIWVTNATVNKNRPGSIKTLKLNSDGSLPYFGNHLVAIGRPKAK